MFRGKESSKRIKLSRLVQDLLNFGVLGSLRLWGWGVGGWGWGVVGGWVDGSGGWLEGTPHTCAHACAHTHAHARTCMRGKHDNFMQMAAPIGGIPENSLCMSYVHARACARVWGAPSHHPPPPSTHLPTPRGGLRNQSKFNSTSTNRDISIPFEDLKSVETSPPMGGCMVWWVGGLMGGVRSKH